jgi:hypothetical protein
MSNPRGINGADVVLSVDGTLIPAQRSLSQSDTTASIDMSSKDSRGMRRAPGRYDSKLSLTALYLPGASGFDQLKQKFRDGQYIDVIRYEPNSGSSWPHSSASGVETASCIITEMSPQFPDQDASTVTLSIEIDGTWEAL